MDENATNVTRPELLAILRSERERLEAFLAGLSPEQMTRPGVEGEWSVKDILAHIVAWEQRMVGWVAAACRGETPPQLANGIDGPELDRWNDETYRQYKDQTLAEVLAAFQASYPPALAAAVETPEPELFEADRFAWRNGQPLWIMVMANTGWHYKEHRESIEKWLETV